MRTTVVIEDALMLELKKLAQRDQKNLKDVLNSTIARGLGHGQASESPWGCAVHDLGAPRYGIEKALQLADALEEDALTLKMELGK
jgi:hypothetical protein